METVRTVLKAMPAAVAKESGTESGVVGGGGSLA